MFKKIFLATFVAITVISESVSANPIGCYTRTGHIEDVDPDGFTVLVTKDGNVWFWEGTTYQTKTGRKKFKVGSRIVVVFDGNATKTPKDDILVDFEIYR